MKLTVAGRNIKITDAIEEHLESKIVKTIKLWIDSADIHVALAVEKHRHSTEITVKTKGFTVHSNHETDDLYKAIDGATEKIEKQLKKHKERSKSLKIKKNKEAKEIVSE
ncbi:MAG: ribosome hibernation-promoting factor, HPF/YfiA family [Nitrospinales bacterium]